MHPEKRLLCFPHLNWCTLLVHTKNIACILLVSVGCLAGLCPAHFSSPFRLQMTFVQIVLWDTIHSSSNLFQIFLSRNFYFTSSRHHFHHALHTSIPVCNNHSSYCKRQKQILAKEFIGRVSVSRL